MHTRVVGIVKLVRRSQFGTSYEIAAAVRLIRGRKEIVQAFSSIAAEAGLS
jgi:hypothetical protein